ncbi:hypothetical protein [uncultured Sphingomonas sp.]|uniref:hypothetical protein n=1 Tax=uncultured Sphingomonas sp. TaxID=158754 RepID=UPI0035CA4750
MTYVQTLYHQTAVLREETAAARAKCVESARAHNILADLHRSQASVPVQTDVTQDMSRSTGTTSPDARIVMVLREPPRP